MKKTISILLVIVFCYNIAGVFLVLNYRKQEARSVIKLRIKNSIPEKELTHISVSNATELKWKRKNEFTFKGTMYDVVRKEKGADGRIHYYCITDKQETVIFAELNRLVKENADSGNNGPRRSKNLYKLFASLYSLPDKKPMLVFHTVQPVEFQYNAPGSSAVADIASPPPKTA